MLSAARARTQLLARRPSLGPAEEELAAVLGVREAAGRAAAVAGAVRAEAVGAAARQLRELEHSVWAELCASGVGELGQVAAAEEMARKQGQLLPLVWRVCPEDGQWVSRRAAGPSVAAAAASVAASSPSPTTTASAAALALTTLADDAAEQQLDDSSSTAMVLGSHAAQDGGGGDDVGAEVTLVGDYVGDEARRLSRRPVSWWLPGGYCAVLLLLSAWVVAVLDPEPWDGQLLVGGGGGGGSAVDRQLSDDQERHSASASSSAGPAGPAWSAPGPAGGWILLSGARSALLGHAGGVDWAAAAKPSRSATAISSPPPPLSSHHYSRDGVPDGWRWSAAHSGSGSSGSSGSWMTMMMVRPSVDANPANAGPEGVDHGRRDTRARARRG
jgi:hypothetical protein